MSDEFSFKQYKEERKRIKQEASIARKKEKRADRRREKKIEGLKYKDPEKYKEEQEKKWNEDRAKAYALFEKNEKALKKYHEEQNIKKAHDFTIFNRVLSYARKHSNDPYHPNAYGGLITCKLCKNTYEFHEWGRRKSYSETAALKHLRDVHYLHDLYPINTFLKEWVDLQEKQSGG